MITTPELKNAAFGLPSAEESGVKLAAALHAPDIAAMRAMDAGTLSHGRAGGRLCAMGHDRRTTLLRQLVDVFDKGEQAPVPLLAGFNSGEIRSLRILAPPPAASATAYEATIRDRYGDMADDFLQLYPSTNLEESILATTRDALYGWTAERLVRKQTALGQPSFLYLFDHGYPVADNAGLHGFHASELPYVFGTADSTPPLWPKIPDNARREGTFGRDDRLLDQLCSHRPAAGSASAGLACVRIDGRVHGFRGNATAGRSSFSRNVRVQRGGRLPAPRGRGRHLEFQCRPIFAQESRADGAV